MRIIHRKRGRGKTTWAIEECLSTGALLVVANARRAAGLRLRFPDLNVTSHSELVLRDHLRGLSINEVVIDDVDALLRRLSPDFVVKAITINGEPEDSK